MSKKGGKQKVEVVNKADKSLIQDWGDLTSAGADLAALRTQPNRNVTIAGFTPAQMAAMNSTNLAAGAFGMPTAEFNMPEMSESAHGILGYSGAPEFDKAVSMLPDDYKAAVESYYANMIGGGGGGNGGGSGGSSDVNTDTKTIDGRTYATIGGIPYGPPLYERDYGDASRN